MSDVPKNTGKDIFIIKSGNFVKWVVFQCPCHKEIRVEVNIMKSRTPYWSVEIEHKKVSLWPSVIVSGVCDCHFWL